MRIMKGVEAVFGVSCNTIHRHLETGFRLE